MIHRVFRKLTPEFVKKSGYEFNVLWTNNRYVFIELNKKKDIWKDIPDYDKNVNPYLYDKNKKDVNDDI